MYKENDPNIVFMGELEDSLDYASFGDFLVKRLKAGGDKISLVSSE
jgi:hypothetical protein